MGDKDAIHTMVAVSKAGIKVDGMAMEVEVEVEEEEILEGAFRMVDLDVAGVENLEEDLIVVEGGELVGIIGGAVATAEEEGFELKCKKRVDRLMSTAS